MCHDMPTVTVVTLSYQRFDKLFDTVLSVLKQDYRSIEYIISDDGSDAFPMRALQEFIDKHNERTVDVKILTSERNQGTVRNANKAYREASGEYVINLSCGDVFYDKHVVERILGRCMAAGADLALVTRLMYLDDYRPQYLLPHMTERNLIGRLDTPKKRYFALISKRSYDMASGSAICVRRTLIESMGYFDERFVLWEDGPFFEKYFWNGDVELAYDIVAMFYQGNGISSKLSAPNPLMREDGQLFFREDVLKHRECLTRFQRGKLELVIELSMANGLKEQMLAYLRHPIHGISQRWYLLRRRFRAKDDLRYLKRYMKECPPYDFLRDANS